MDAPTPDFAGPGTAADGGPFVTACPDGAPATAQDGVRRFILDGWDSCVKVNPEDQGTLIGLPYPYTVPAVGHFDEMYYWDTYFTNVGLLLSGRMQQAKHNVDNMLYLVNRFGFMPNGNRTFYLNRSQPPFLSIMVRDVYERIRDRSWLKKAYAALELEYTFWTTKRNSPVGLSHYDAELTDDQMDGEAENFCNRVGFRPNGSHAQLARHYLANAESGWDITPRWGVEAYHYATVELNSLLYALEKNMAFFAGELSAEEASKWENLAALRKQRMTALLETEEGLFMDYHYVTGKRSTILSAAIYYPMFVGLAEPRHARAVVQNLSRLEAEHGILTCEANAEPGNYQWNYPNGWACLQYIAISGLARCGYTEEARRIAQKYIALVDRVFRQTGNLWEKYNVAEGNLQVVNEYGLPPMMGWSAGVYLAALDFLGL